VARRVVESVRDQASEAGLTASPALAKCSKDCKKQIASEYKACKTGCAKDKTCRKGCIDEKKADAATCKAAANPTPPNCGGTEDSDGQFSGPQGVAVDGSGNVFVAD
jgi:hypothetical protein